VAIENRGIDDLARAVEKSRQFQQNASPSAGRKQAVARWRIIELLRERLVSETLGRDGASERLEQLAAEVATKKRDPYSAAEELLRS
jgi:LAO/AO transport system kinase